MLKVPYVSPVSTYAPRGANKLIHRILLRALLVLPPLVAGCESDRALLPSSDQPAFAPSKPIEKFHAHVTGSFSEEVCGIVVNTNFVVTENFFLHADGSFKVATSGRFTFTNPANGKSVIVSFAGLRPSGSAPIVDEEAGTITFISTFKGLPEKIQTANGAVLLRDAGIIAFAETFDLVTGEFISSETIVNKGPHPEGDSGFTLFCEVFSSALT